MNTQGFASDNYSGIHPEILKAISNVNSGHVTSYGDDEITGRAIQRFKKIFGSNAETFFVFNGTAANVLGLKAVTQPHQAIICVETAHIQTDECGAPERFTGCKLLTVPSDDGKLHIEHVKTYLHAFGFQHHSQPRVISISQATEMGTVYTPEEIWIIADFAHRHNMLLHIDGSRLSNAAASLSVDFKTITVDAGADLLSFGGTKNGLMCGETIVFFRPGLAHDFQYIRKQGMQLASKMRFVSAQFLAYLQNEQWRKTANHSNNMAKLLAGEIARIPQIRITQKVEANGIFAIVPRKIIPRLQEKYFFYVWNEETSEVRWMTSWDTTPEHVMGFVATIKDELAKLDKIR
jgi:threonine aldolase